MRIGRYLDRALFKISAFALLCVGFFIFHIWMRTLALTTGFEVGESRRGIAKLESELAEARVERNRVMGPEHLQRLVGDFAAQGVVFQPPKAAQLIYSKARQ